MGTKRVTVRLPDDLLEKAEVAAAVTHKNRTQIIVEALNEYFEEVQNDDRFKEAVVELFFDDQISFEILTEFIGRQDAESVRASKTLLDQGDDIPDDLAGR